MSTDQVGLLHYHAAQKHQGRAADLNRGGDESWDRLAVSGTAGLGRRRDGAELELLPASTSL
ncbi:hypothetical protein [Microbispora sp. NBRC 16548]|uniref:hypothetical protein n=1 Tax=Microbispora sp. NBRC 16548 TaxID=3030994 RepID=UPI0024A26C10|nr:hypothetical protein [Microbispora sp. NBRC 16548]GLX11458.1 hypothetical protein Misp03_83840 [Microbispora sp. NBRC 16548]